MSYSSALGISDPIELVLTKTNDRDEGELVGKCSIQWRQLLTESSGRSKLTVEVGGVCSEAKITAGLLDVKLEIIPKASELLQNELLTAQLGLERQRNSERERLFLVYAKQWWKEYLQIRASHSQRLVKIFAPDERGTHDLPSLVSKLSTSVALPFCNFHRLRVPELALGGIPLGFGIVVEVECSCINETMCHSV